MKERRLKNLPLSRQLELRSQFPWLKHVHEAERPSYVSVASVSVFDHWLSVDEACDLLEDVSTEEQARRNSLHARFCADLIERTLILSFAFLGRRGDQVMFREFVSKGALYSYFTPNGGKTLRHRQFHVAMPELDCVFYESWDDTNNLFFTNPKAMHEITELAHKSGLYVLSHG